MPRYLLGGLITAVLFVGAVAATALLIPGDRVAAAVASRAEALLGQRVRIDDVGLRFLPLPGVHLSGILVGGTGEEDALASAESMELRAKLLPLLRGEVVVSTLSLERPRLLVAFDSAGVSNLPVLRGDTAVVDTTGGRDIGFAIDRLTVSDGRITWHDARDGTTVELDGWDQQLRIGGRIEEGSLGSVDLTGWLEIEDLDATLPGVVLPVRDLSLRMTHDATLDQRADRLELRTVGLDAGGVTLQGSGTVDSASSGTARVVALELGAEGFDAARLITLAPDSLRARLALPDGRRIEPAGLASLRLVVEGPLTSDSFPAFDGVLRLADGALTAGNQALAEGIRGQLVFSADTAVLRADGALLGERFGLAAALRQPEAPTAIISFNGSADLGRLRTLGVLPDTMDAAGAVRSEMQALVPIRNLAAARMAGTVQLVGVRITGTDVPVGVPAGTLTFAGQQVRLDPFTLRLGDDTDIEIRAAADGWIAAAADSAASPATISAEITAGTLDLDRLLGPPESEYPALLFARLRDLPLEDGRTASEAAEAAGMSLPALPRVEAEARIRAGRLVRNAMVYDDVDATVRITPDTAQLLAGSFGLMGGTVRAAGTLTPTLRDSTGAPQQARITATYALSDVEAAPFFDRLTPFRDHLAGDLAMAGSMVMDLDHQALPERATLGADGNTAISNGRLANWRVLQAAGARLGLPALDTIRFRDWAGGFRVTGPLVALNEVALEGQEISARAAGSFDFGGRLDLGATVYLTRELASRAGAIGQRVVAAAGADGRVPVSLRITGTTSEPAIGLDLSEAAGNVVARAQEAAEREAQAVAARAVDAAMDRLEVPDSLRGLPADSLRKIIGDSLFELLPDSLRAPSDSLRTQAEEALRRRLRSLFGGG